MFADRVDWSIVRKPGNDFLPSGAEVAGAVDVRLQVVEAEAIDGGVDSSRVEVRSLQNGNLAPGSKLRRSDILPGLSAVASELNQAIVCAGPQRACFLEGGCEGINRAAMLSLFGVARGKSPEIRGDFRRLARQVRTDDLPRAAAIGRLEQNICGEIESARIERRKDDR